LSETRPTADHDSAPDLPDAEAKRQITLLRAEVRRLTDRFDQQTDVITALSRKNDALQEAFDTALAERDKILTSTAWRATRAVQHVMTIPRRVLSPILKPRAAAPPPQAEPSAAEAYAAWVRAYDTLTPLDRDQIAALIDRLGHRPAISIVIPDGGVTEALLEKTLASLAGQIYPAAEICLGKDKRACGDFVALVAPGDLLPAQALFEIALEILAHPDVGMIYTDEDRIDVSGRRHDPAFKPDFSFELQLGSPLTGHLAVYRRSLLDELGVSPEAIGRGAEQALALQAALGCGLARIRHIPAVLCHRLVPAAQGDAAAEARDPERDAALAAIARRMGDVAIAPMPGHAAWNRVIWPLPPSLPRVSVIIPTRDRADLLARCVMGLLYRTDYPDLEILIIDNDSIDAGTLSLFQLLRTDARVRVVRSPGPFNYSALNNVGMREARGDILVMLNNDVDVMGGGWLKEMVSHAVRPEVGAVGAKLIYGDSRIQHAGVVLGVGQHDAGPGVAGHFGHHEEADDPGYLGQFALTRAVSAVTGACLAVRRDVFLAVGGLDETALPVSFNDVDLCLRIGALGLRIIWTPFAELYHLESASRGQAETPEQVARAAREADYMRDRWGAVLDADPFYNPNFDRRNHAFELARPPYRRKPWRPDGE
jgi:GT2 family glycosyltransferase